MKDLRKVWLLIISILLLLPIIPSEVNSKDSIPKRRIVTLIYDDSGSMWKGGDQKPIDNWKYANYALQSLVGLLDANDVLNVITMSNPTQSKNVNLEENSRQNQINDIRTWAGNKSTPIETISTAIKQINGYSTKYPNAEYWLIILTDGVFVELDPKYNGNTMATVSENRMLTERSLTDLTHRMKMNEISFNSALVTIESYLSPDHKGIMGDFKKLWVTSTSGTVIESDSEERIVDDINKVAALITNRDPDETKLFNLNARFLDDRVLLESPLPLRRITVLHQSREGSPAISIKDVSLHAKRKQIGMEGPFLIIAPNDPYRLTPEIKGSITHIKQGKLGEVIPQGEYELIFSSNMNEEQKSTIRFLAEPAIDFNIKVKRVNTNGTLSDDASTFFADSKMVLDVELVQSETKKPILLDKVKKEIFKISTLVDGQSLHLKWNDKKKTFTGNFDLVEKEQINANVKVQIDGLYQKEKTITFTGFPSRKLELKRAEDNLWTAKVDRLEDGKPIEIIPFVNGKEMTELELRELFKNVKVGSKGHRIGFELSLENNHMFIKPEKKGATLSTSTGTIPVLVTMTGVNSSENAELEFFINIEDIPWYKRYGYYLILLLIMVFAIILIIGVIVKPRFANERISMTYERFLIIDDQRIKQGQLTTENFKTNFFERWMIPYRAERKSIHGILFKATSTPDKICLPKQSQNPKMVVAGTDISEDCGRKDILIYSNDDIKIEDYSSIEIYTLKTS
jgi:hypothetical protein